MDPPSRPGIRFRCVHAEGENASLDGRHAEQKQMFGIVPGCRYGWPKNVLHWAGIHESILDICATVRPHFVIADAIVAGCKVTAHSTESQSTSKRSCSPMIRSQPTPHWRACSGSNHTQSDTFVRRANFLVSQ